MSPSPFILEFSEDFRQCRVFDERNHRLLVVAVVGDVPPERRDRIAQLIGGLLEECQGGAVVIAPFVGRTPS